MKASDLMPEQKAELQKRYKDAGLSGPIHLMTVEKVEEKISNALKDEEVVIECKPFDFSVDVFKQVTKKNEEGNEYLAQVPQELDFSPSKIWLSTWVVKFQQGKANYTQGIHLL